jgi:hypothetical protein
MSERRKPVTYDAIEGPDHVVLCLDAPNLECGLADVVVLGGRRIEAIAKSGATIRFSSVHPRVVQACQRKPVLIATMDRGCITVSAKDDSRLVKDAKAWFPPAFYWYLDPLTISLGDLAERPVPRMMEAIGVGVVAASPASDGAAPPFAMCLHSELMVALPGGRRWCRARKGLLVEATLATFASEGHPAGDDIFKSVVAAFQPDSPIPSPRPRSMWRSQLAVYMPGA